MTPAYERASAVLARRFGLRPAAQGHESALGPAIEARRAALGLALDEYAARLDRDASEQWALAAALSNGWTWFFRDREQLESAVRRIDGPASIWVAGCSTGEEAYGVAMLCAERGIDARILATDIARDRLEVAARGVYDAHAIRALSAEERARWLEPLGRGAWRVPEPIRRTVELRPHNLMDPPPAFGAFDLIVCRNVLIYATAAGAAQMVRGLTQALAPSAELVLGASDLLHLPIGGAPVEPAPTLEAPARDSVRPAEPIDAAALVTLGNLCIEAHAFDRAEAAYRRAEMLEPCSAELHLAWGVLHRKRGEHELALGSLRRAAFLDPSLWPAWALLAGVLARLGARAESAAAAEQARHARRERPRPAWRSHTGRLLRDALGFDAPSASAPTTYEHERAGAGARGGE